MWFLLVEKERWIFLTEFYFVFSSEYNKIDGCKICLFEVWIRPGKILRVHISQTQCLFDAMKIELTEMKVLFQCFSILESSVCN